jgi:hypothetical protein
MDKVEQLIIRACKSGDSELSKVKRIYTRFFQQTVESESQVYDQIAALLAKIADQYSLLKTSTLIEAFDPVQARYYGIRETDTHSEKVIKILISKIALSPKYRFPGLTPPLALRQPNREICIA